jgi:hypothetical protein
MFLIPGESNSAYMFANFKSSVAQNNNYRLVYYPDNERVIFLDMKRLLSTTGNVLIKKYPLRYVKITSAYQAQKILTQFIKLRAFL